MRILQILMGAAASLALAMPALAQETVAIVGGRVLTGTSVVENGTVVISDGRVVSAMSASGGGTEGASPGSP